MGERGHRKKGKTEGVWTGEGESRRWVSLERTGVKDLGDLGGRKEGSDGSRVSKKKEGGGQVARYQGAGKEQVPEKVTGMALRRLVWEGSATAAWPSE